MRKTGVSLKLDYDVLAEIVQWVLYFTVLAVAAVAGRIGRRQRMTIWFTPDRPRPWYLIRGAALWAGISVANNRANADAEFYFDDVTVGGVPPGLGLRQFNFGCQDISKSRVAAIFADVFGYDLAVDPRSFDGVMAEKSEKNGVHDGCVTGGPAAPVAGRVYQHLIDTTDDSNSAHDLRTLCAGGRPVLVWLKIKPAGKRFAIHNRAAFLRTPDSVFTAAELELIQKFTARIGLDWGGLDILRDRHTGRIYIVDVNKTDVGPVIALSWRDKVRSMRILAVALRDLMAAPLPKQALPRAKRPITQPAVPEHAI